MSLKQILTLISLAAVSFGFIIPKNHPNGVYLATPNKNGTCSHARIGDAGLVSRDSVLHGVHARQGTFIATSTGCASGTVTETDYTGAINNVSNQCATPLTKSEGNHAYALSGDAVAFMCNYGGDNPCVASELHTALGIIGAECLNYHAWMGPRS